MYTASSLRSRLVLRLFVGLLCFSASLSATWAQLGIAGPRTVCAGSLVSYSVTDVADPDNTFSWTLDGGGVIVGTSLGTDILVDWNATQGGAVYSLNVVEIGATALVQSATIGVSTPAVGLVCNTDVQVSIDNSGSNTIGPDILLQGNFADYSIYTVTVEDALGQPQGNTVDCSQLGQTLTVRVTNTCNGNSCWGSIRVEDKRPPVFDCPAPQTLACDVDPFQLPPPPVTDNCDVPTPTLVSQTLDNDDICGAGVMVTRTWVATDASGNVSQPCTQVFNLVSPGLPVFPADVVWRCAQAAAQPGITDAAPLNTAILDTDLATAAIDVDPDLPTAILNNTGSGEVRGATGTYCAYSTSFADDTVSICGGSFKILRTWTVFNWCTDEIVTVGANGGDNLQVIKVLDETAPVVVVAPITVAVDAAPAAAIACVSNATLPLPVVTDNCGGASLRIFTPVGEADYANGTDAADGATIPFPGLEVGTYSLIYKATDDCGNVQDYLGALIVRDEEVPFMACDQITEVALDNLGQAILNAAVLDDGSSDNCGIERFEIKRMGTPDSAFAPSIDLGCTDPASQQVVLRAYDFAGNFNECMVTVLTVDKIAPGCTAPADTQIGCLDIAAIDLADSAQTEAAFGVAAGVDNCSVSVTELPLQSNLTDCGTGTLVRRFVSTDAAGNTTTCQQVITVFSQSDFEIDFPADYSTTCGSPILADSLSIVNAGCHLFAVNVSDEYFDIDNNQTCAKIVRTYEVLDWCTPNGSTQVVTNDSLGVRIDENSFSPGIYRYTYQQIIKIYDAEAPTVVFAGDVDFCAYDTDDCGAALVSLPISTSDNCTADLTITWALDAFSNGEIEATGTGLFTGTYPVGAHRLTYTVSDDCGNATETVIEFAVLDCLRPTAYCVNGIILELMANGTVTVWASDFDAGSYDNCSADVQLSFSPDVDDIQHTFTCADAPMAALQLYVTDAAGNQDFCTVFATIQDNMNACTPAATVQVAGSVRSALDQPVSGVLLQTNNWGNTTTGTDGDYTLADITSGSDITIVPEKTDDTRAGVSTFDIVLISKHILGTETFDSPYQLLAADANNSGTISALDMVTLRKLILYYYDELPDSPDWRFVPTNHLFADPANPWAGYPTFLNYNDLDQAVTDADFTAIKIGDVNGSFANLAAASAAGRNAEAVELALTDPYLRAGETYALPLRTSATELAGLQLALGYADLDLTVLTDGLLQAEHIRQTDDALLLSWDGTLDQSHLLTLQVTAPRAGYLREFLQLDARLLAGEAYSTAASVRPLALAFADAPVTAPHLTVSPNPFVHQTTLLLDLPTAGEGHLRVVDATGRTVFQQQQYYPAGRQRLALDARAWPATGVYRVLLRVGDHQLSKSVLRLER